MSNQNHERASDSHSQESGQVRAEQDDWYNRVVFGSLAEQPGLKMPKLEDIVKAAGLGAVGEEFNDSSEA